MSIIREDPYFSQPIQSIISIASQQPLLRLAALFIEVILKQKIVAASVAALFLPFSVSLAHAQNNSDQNPVVLPEVTVEAAQDGDIGFTAKKAAGSTKSDASLLETPQSISVLTRELLDSQQAVTLTDALRNVTGVVSGNFGRRGWDDFIIRGQRATESVFLDGLSVSQNAWVAQEPFGMERVEVLKGPASILFGKVQPGGMVNMVSKKPRSDAFNEVGVTIGSDSFKQATFDLGRPISENGKSAFRINGLLLDRDDPTEFVYQKHRWIAPSLTLDVGPDTDFTLLTSYNYNEYIRQQGLSPYGTILPNVNGEIPWNRFIGERAFGPYTSEQYRVGYTLEHRFSPDLKLQQNFRWQEQSMQGRAVFNGTLQANQLLQNRSATLQDSKSRVIGLDTNIEKKLDLLGMKHSVMGGLDLAQDRDRFKSSTCTLAALNLYQPVYGATITCPANWVNDNTTTFSSTALYLRDRIEFNDRLSVLLGVRREDGKLETLNNNTSTTQTQNTLATTSSSALMFKISSNVTSYISHADSFLPLSGLKISGEQLKPETGKQSEIGLKFASEDGRLTSGLAVYDLKRQNVSAFDPANTGYNLQIGEQRSKGVEADMAMDLRNGWNLIGGYTYTDSEVTKDNVAANVGTPLNSVPRHAATLWGTYTFRQAALHGVSVGAGVRYSGAMRGYSYSYTIPGYTLADAALNYAGNGYKLALNVKNLFDKKYYPGALSNNVVALGDPRQVLLNATFFF